MEWMSSVNAGALWPFLAYEFANGDTDIGESAFNAARDEFCTAFGITTDDLTGLATYSSAASASQPDELDQPLR